MAELLVPFFLVPLVDHALKRVVRAKLSTAALRLGPIGVVTFVRSDMWIARARRFSRIGPLWMVWVVAALALLAATSLSPGFGVSAGLMLGASLSHLIERTIHGGISDYVCLRFWPPFDLADVALTTGAIGTVAQLMAVISRTVA